MNFYGLVSSDCKVKEIRDYVKQLDNTCSGAGAQVIQMATVAGFRNDAKDKKGIGADIHSRVQEIFLADEKLGNKYELYIEHEFSNRRRADIVAVRDERYREDDSDFWIYVGEIKPESVLYNSFAGAAADQLADYINLFQQEFPLATVSSLNFWLPQPEKINYAGRDYILIITGNGRGLYTYQGVQNISHAPAAQEKISEIEDQDSDELLPFNERPDYMFL